MRAILNSEITQTVIEAATFLRNAEQAVYWLQQVEMHDRRDEARVIALRQLCADIYSASMRLDEIYPRPGMYSPNNPPYEDDLTEAEKMRGGYINKSGRYVMTPQEEAFCSENAPKEITDEEFELKPKKYVAPNIPF